MDPAKTPDRPPPRHAPAAAAAGLLMVAGLGYLDYLTGADLSFLVFYVIPAALAGWYGGRTAAIVVAVGSTAAWYAADAMTAASAPHPLISAWNASMKLGILLAVALLLSALRLAYEAQKTQARTDPLTGVANRRAFLDHLDQEVLRAGRYRRPLTLAYFDIDNFKTVNDLYGHGEGDRLLHAAATSVREAVRRSDRVARIGGDEFAILFPETGADSAQAAIEKCRRILSEAASRGGWPVTFSFGVVTCICPLESGETLLRKADALLLEAKKTGKNRTCLVVLDGNGGGSGPA